MSMLVNPFIFGTAEPDPLEIGTDSNWWGSVTVFSGTAITCSLPAAAAAGDLCVYVVTIANSRTSTWTAGWTELEDQTGTCRQSYAYKVLDSADITAGTVTCTASGSVGQASGVTIIIRNHDVATSAPVDGTGVAGTSTSPNPPSTSHGWGTGVDTCFIAAICCAAAGTITASPSGYTEINTTGPNYIRLSYKIAKASSDDPGTGTIGSSVAWRCNTIAVRGLV